jgi:CRP/FNR family transcriptional regulator
MRWKLLFGKGDFFGDLEVIRPSNARVISAVAMNDTLPVS